MSQQQNLLRCVMLCSSFILLGCIDYGWNENESSNTVVTESHGAVHHIHPNPFERIGTFMFERAYIKKLIYKLDLWFFQL